MMRRRRRARWPHDILFALFLLALAGGAVLLMGAAIIAGRT